MSRQMYYNVAPRYSPGSPAQVDYETALRVANDERWAYAIAIQGIYGADEQKLAREKGLKGIVEERRERSGCWIVTDLVTGEKFIRPFPVVQSTDTTTIPPPLRRKMVLRDERLKAKYHLPVEGD